MNQFALLLSFHPLAPPLQTYTRYLTFYYSTVYFIQTHNDICVLHGLNCFCTSIKKAEFVYFDYTPPLYMVMYPLVSRDCYPTSYKTTPVHQNQFTIWLFIKIYTYIYIYNIYMFLSIYPTIYTVRVNKTVQSVWCLCWNR